jgi:hypothetical protein
MYLSREPASSAAWFDPSLIIPASASRVGTFLRWLSLTPLTSVPGNTCDLCIFRMAVSFYYPILISDADLNGSLNALGFPLGPEAEREKIQNLGLQDQIMALRWIQENIAAFGGNPTKVDLRASSFSLEFIQCNRSHSGGKVLGLRRRHSTCLTLKPRNYSMEPS